MSASPEERTEDSRSAKTRLQLRATAWILLVASLLLAFVGPRLTRSNLPADISTRMGDIDWLSLAWIIAAMIVGALAFMCFVAQWVLRPRAHQQKAAQSKVG